MKTIVRRIGLVAHDAMKKDMIEWVLWNSERLIGHKFYCTGTTGRRRNRLSVLFYRSDDTTAARYGCESIDQTGWS